MIASLRCRPFNFSLWLVSGLWSGTSQKILSLYVYIDIYIHPSSVIVYYSADRDFSAKPLLLLCETTTTSISFRLDLAAAL